MARKLKNSQGYSPRILNSRSPKQRFLIVCEGTKTEPNYFRSFRVPKVVIDIEGLGRNPTKLVEYAIDRRSEDDFDQVWCVFDRDVWTIQDFQQAFKLAIQNKIKVSVMNYSRRWQ